MCDIKDLAIYGGRLFVADGENGVAVYEIDEDSGPSDTPIYTLGNLDAEKIIASEFMFTIAAKTEDGIQLIEYI